MARFDSTGNETLDAAIGSYISRHRRLSDPNYATGQCEDVSEDFAAECRADGLDAEVVCYARGERGIPAEMTHLFRTDPAGSPLHYVVEVDGFVVDMTAAQYEEGFFPMVYER